jgi:S-DNA-T family DNA segregation ATPase FtsK/SpoIIIE
MPHLLIAGATGSGKSVCLNAILVCLLMNYTPDQLKLVLIDPKRVELTGYNGIPHLITPVITDVEQVGNVLQWILREMDMRNLHFMQTGVRNIQDYNQKNPDKILPYLVVVIDELANLMMEAASDIETSITRLAQTARAMGIHIIVATQRPSRDVITGTIKGNLPSRIAFAVATNIDSHVILDRSGAENLFGKGDMYFMSSEDSNLKRLQCVYVSDDEIRKLVDYWKKNPRIGDEQSEMKTNTISPVTVRAQPQITQGTLTQLPMLNEDISSVKKGDDPLLNEAIAMVRKQGRASANMLVSRLSIGFTRANKLLSQMEDMGIISPPNANPAIPREILDYGENGAPPED